MLFEQFHVMLCCQTEVLCYAMLCYFLGTITCTIVLPDRSAMFSSTISCAFVMFTIGTVLPNYYRHCDLQVVHNIITHTLHR
jgi:hypothetical protein